MILLKLIQRSEGVGTASSDNAPTQTLQFSEITIVGESNSKEKLVELAKVEQRLCYGHAKFILLEGSELILKDWKDEAYKQMEKEEEENY